MDVEVEVDGSFFTFPDGWQVEKVDDWGEHKPLTEKPFHAKACDLVAVCRGQLWLVEAKDYTYPGARVPSDLAQQVGLKVYNSLATLHAVALWGEGQRSEFSKTVLKATEARVCLAVELPHMGRGLMGVATPIANLKDSLKRITRKFGVHRPVVSNSFYEGNVPWVTRRDPATREKHADR